MVATPFVTDIEERKKIVYGKDLKLMGKKAEKLLFKIAEYTVKGNSNKVDIFLDRICAYWYLFTLTNKVNLKNDEIIINFESTKDAFKTCYMSFLHIYDLYYNVKKAKKFNFEQIQILKLLLNEKVEFFKNMNNSLNMNHRIIFVTQDNEAVHMSVDDMFNHKKTIELLLNSLYFEICALKGLYNIFSNDTYRVEFQNNFLFKKDSNFLHESLTFPIKELKDIYFRNMYIAYDLIFKDILKVDENEHQYMNALEVAMKNANSSKKSVMCKRLAISFSIAIVLVIIGTIISVAFEKK